MTNAREIPTPALDKMAACKADSQKIGEFVEWLQSKRIHWFNEPHCKDCGGTRIGVSSEQDGYCKDCGSENLGYRWGSMEAMLAEYFEIDLDAVERERRQLLDQLYAAHELGGEG